MAGTNNTDEKEEGRRVTYRFWAIKDTEVLIKKHII